MMKFGSLEEDGLILSTESLFSEKADRIKAFISSHQRALIAFSGGCDSALIAKLCRDLLGYDRTLAVTSKSEALPRHEIKEVNRFVATYHIQHQWIVTREIENPNYIQNSSKRCYFCKSELYKDLSEIAKSWQADVIFNGTNADDLGDWRPGLKAAKEFHIRSPFLEANFTKQDVRKLSRELNLMTWNKPAAACLSSRFAYGQEISAPDLRRIDQGEQILHDHGFHVVRLRKMGRQEVVIEVGKDELPRLMQHPHKKLIFSKIKALGFYQVDVDPEGYVPGKLNRFIKKS